MLEKKRRFQINNLIFHLKKLEIKEQTKLKASRRKKIIKIRAEINEIGNRKITEKKNQQNQELVLWPDHQNWQILARLDKKQSEDDSNY